MAPPHGVLTFCASATVVAAAVTSVTTAVNTAKEAVTNLVLKRCDKCNAKVKDEDMQEHLEKHKKDEEEKEELAHKLRTIEIRMESMKLEMQKKENSMEENARRREQELAEVKAQLEIICDICKECVHMKDKKAHANIHREVKASHSRIGELNSDIRQERTGKRKNNRK